MFKIAFCVLDGVNSLFKAFITAVVIVLVVADSLYECTCEKDPLGCEDYPYGK